MRWRLFKRSDDGAPHGLPHLPAAWIAAVRRLAAQHWHTIGALLIIFALALFIRGYFGLEPATEGGFILSGGSDSYYYHHAIRHAYDTGQHLYQDHMINYPASSRNPRPPLYAWSVVIAGHILTPFFGGNGSDAVWYAFLLSTAVAGALTIFPVYLVGRESFGRRAGLIAALLLAVSPGHLQRSVMSNADHDAFVLFFIVLGFYFYLRGLKLLSERDYVGSWRKPSTALSGIMEMARENRSSLLYGGLAAFCFLAVMLTWQGYAYAFVILTAYFMIQVLITRLRKRELLGHIAIYAVAFGLPLLLGFPYYYQADLIASWYDAPAFMFLAAVGISAVLMISRNYPWFLVISGMVLAAVLGFTALYFASVSMFNTLIGAIASGAGYFVRTKQYETIAEAQAPPFSNLATSFGMITFWMALVGLGYGLYRLPKSLKPDYIFILLWTLFSIYMAMSAARFMFNAAPAFAIMSGWVLSIIVEKLDIKGEVARQARFRGSATYTRGTVLTALAASLLICALSAAAYEYLRSPAPISLGLAGFLVLLFMVYVYGTRRKDRFYLLALLPLVVSLLVYGFYYDGFKRLPDHAMVPLLTGMYLVVLFFAMRGTKMRTIAGVLFLSFLVVLPNVWTGVDAGIPYEVKRDYDRLLYQVMPSPTAPEGYDAQNGSMWYLGGFGYSLPLNNRYWPAGYDWLATQDAGIYPFHERPGFLSWWDYGFEVVNEGAHPTVADNFLNGHQLAGNFLMAQNETNAIALFCVRLLESDWAWPPGIEDLPAFRPEVRGILERYGIDPEEMGDILTNPMSYVPEIHAHPEIYDPRDADIQPTNAYIMAMMARISMHLNRDQVADLYHDLQTATGWSIRYFAVDTRLFPFSGQNTGIFYAPAKLSDHRMMDAFNMPYDFFEIKAVGEFGGEYNVTEVPEDVRVTEYKLKYKDMFFKTMLYRCFVGYSGADIGQSNEEGIPGLSGSLQQQPPMPGYMLRHFRLVYRTAYYNPYPPEEVRNHTEAWRAMNYDDAAELQRQIQAGTAEGVVDLSPRSSMYQGVTMLKYYDGAVVYGQVRLRNGAPLTGIRVTVQDAYGIPHDTVLTDASGRYSVLAPFGNVSVIVSQGTPMMLTMTGGELNATQFFIRDDQAMRQALDLDADGRFDYLIEHNVKLDAASASGTVYIDGDGDSIYDEGEVVLPGIEVEIIGKELNASYRTNTDEDGKYSFEAVSPGEYRMVVRQGGIELVSADSVPISTAAVKKDMAVPTRNFEGAVLNERGI
ncbi:MAG: STT3 domain-containing protein, partial [Candidatus Thermoplasmatota archaeon]